MTSAKLGTFTCLFVALGLACQPHDSGTSSEDSSETGGTADSDDTVTGDTGDGDPTPILERTPVLSHDCVLTVPLTAVADSDWRTEALAVLDGAVWQVRAGSDALVLSTLTADGALGASIELDGDDFAFKEADLVAADGQLAAAWIHSTQMDGVSIRFAVVAGDGTVKVAAQQVSGVSGQFLQSPRVLPRAGGWTLFYGTADDGGLGTIQRLQLDAAGAVVGAPVEVITGGQNYGTFNPSVVASADGHALTYSVSTDEGPEVFFLALDAAGAPRTAARRLSHVGAEGWYSYNGNKAQALLAVGDRFWATWTETVGSSNLMDPKGNTTVHIAVLDADGEGSSSLLSAPVEGRSADGPALFAFGDRVGVTWTNGTQIFICGGCMADDDAQVVLLDPTTVAPASAVVTHPRTTSGLVRPHAGVLGPQIVLTADLDLHALTLPAVGSTTCTPKT